MPEDKPKRKYTRSAPFEPEPLKPSEMADDKIKQDSLTLSMEQQACALLAVEFGIEHAALHLQWTVQEVDETLALPEVRRYLEKANDMLLKRIVDTKFRNMCRVGISQAALEQRLWTLVNMDPAETKGSIDGQVKAATVLIDKLGYSVDRDPLSDKTPDELKAIVTKKHLQIEGSLTPKTVN